MIAVACSGCPSRGLVVHFHDEYCAKSAWDIFRVSTGKWPSGGRNAPSRGPNVPHMPLIVSEPGFSPQPLDYVAAWELQRQLHASVVAGPSAVGHLLLLEHPPTYTAGRRTTDADRPVDGTPVIDVDRGGLLTWHGPGQLIAYPIARLADPMAIRDYVFRLEAALIETLAAFGIEGVRVDGRAGVWVLTPGEADRKIAAIGIHVEDGVTMHGVALNVSNALEPYDVIVPCGITDAGVTTMNLLTGGTHTPASVAPTLLSALNQQLEPALAQGALLA